MQVLACLLFCGFAANASALDRPWYLYESAYFEAYSDASGGRVTRLLEELENFRAAVEQLLKLRPPPGAPKTQVIIFRSRRDFRDITGDLPIDAFAITSGGLPHMVMTSGGPSDRSNVIIRHEFTHILTAYTGHNLPKWFIEGFAEFMSGTTFRKRGTEFTIGEATGRMRSRAAWVDWDELMYGDFEFHAEPNEYILNNAYLQAWLLVHYLMIGDDSTYNEALRNYLARYASGDDPETAVVEEFGMSADELGRMILRRYNNKVPAFLMEFRPGIQDHDFVRSELDSSSIEHSLDRLREQFRMRMN